MFNLKGKKEKNDRDQVVKMIGEMGVRVRDEEIVDVVRMRKKDEGGVIRSIIVDFRAEYDKWTVLRNRADLREMNEYRNVFRAGCIEKGKGEETSKDPRTEGRMGVERNERSKRKECGKEKSSTVIKVWKNVRKIRRREKQME